jgi:pimeloyl-ACP methyl ester carboxylesterase
MTTTPLVLLHGYAAQANTFDKWKSILQGFGFNGQQDIFIGNYVTLNNEITVDDISEGFDRALRAKGLDQQPFDIIVHSTGMLVLRAWLTAPNANNRQRLLKHVIAFAPATFGSPLATKGRSLLGRIFLGNHQLGPDFLNSGSLVLNNLEIGSSYTWYLAHRDLFGTDVFYDAKPDTPYVFVFDGTSDYGELAEIFLENDQLGSDGVVRWAGVSLNSRKVTLDLTRTPSDKGRLSWSKWTNIDIPLIPVAGVNHNQILSQPPSGLPELVLQALKVDGPGKLNDFYDAAAATDVVKKGHARIDSDPWQQFVVHAVDERGTAIDDYSIEILMRAPDGKDTSVSAFENDVHPYTLDNSFRCFHVRLKDVPLSHFGAPGNKVIARVSASTGTDMLGYQGFGDTVSQLSRPSIRSSSISPARLLTLTRNCFSPSQRP